MNVDTHAPLGLSLAKTKNQRTTKCPLILGFKATRCGVETIQKIRECELHRLEGMVGVPFVLRPRGTPISKPSDPPLLFERLGWK